MGKSRRLWFAPGKGSAKRGPTRCLGCKKGLVYGERCPACATEARVKAAKRRRKR